MPTDGRISPRLDLTAVRRAVGDVRHHRPHRIGEPAELGERCSELESVQLLRLVQRPLFEQDTRQAVATVLEPLQRVLVAVDYSGDHYLDRCLDAALCDD